VFLHEFSLSAGEESPANSNAETRFCECSLEFPSAEARAVSRYDHDCGELVAQIFNLLYRRISFGRALENARALKGRARERPLHHSALGIALGATP
jgi:hypothetical protein